MLANAEVEVLRYFPYSPDFSPSDYDLFPELCLGNSLQTERTFWQQFSVMWYKASVSGDADGVGHFLQYWQQTTDNLRLFWVCTISSCCSIFTWNATIKQTMIQKSCGVLASYHWLLYVHPRLMVAFTCTCHMLWSICTALTILPHLWLSKQFSGLIDWPL
jgi:hypothetical protein